MKDEKIVRQAKEALNGKPFTAIWTLSGVDNNGGHEQKIVKEEILPDFVPAKDDHLIIDDKEYVVTGRDYYERKNKVFVYLMSRKEHDKFHEDLLEPLR